MLSPSPITRRRPRSAGSTWAIAARALPEVRKQPVVVEPRRDAGEDAAEIGTQAEAHVADPLCVELGPLRDHVERAPLLLHVLSDRCYVLRPVARRQQWTARPVVRRREE